MEMDDPWGSPWAEEVRIHPDLTSDKVDRDVRPTTPAQTSKLALEDKTHSPWDNPDDGGFGSWAAISGEDEGVLGLDGKVEDWEEADMQARSQLKGNLSSALPWEDTVTLPVKKFTRTSPSLLPKFEDFGRQPSPDPWAIQFQNVEENITPGTQGQGKESAIADVGIISDSKPRDPPQIHQSLSEESLPGVSTLPSEIFGGSDEESRPSDFEEEILESPVVVEDSRITNGPGDREIVSSRPSSSPSEHSRHEETLQDSPRTSIEDEPKRPHVPRKVSSKIQGLVEHFDNLAQLDEGPEVVRIIREKTPEADMPLSDNARDAGSLTVSTNGLQPEDEMEDFGDFEEGNSEDEEIITDSEIPLPSDPVRTSSQESSDGHEGTAIPRIDYGPVTFNIRTNALDDLYSNNAIEPSTEKVFVPDRDLDNTLASTEQRKTWYRISRYGTKRKHDTGDDESYVRVGWAHSQIRDDTLKIVARWMEEDRISGRVVLGGVSKGSSVFGWTDMKAAPVPIALAFAAKRVKDPGPSVPAPLSDVPREWPKGLARSRSTSNSHSPPTTRRRTSMKSLSISGETPMSGPEIPIASFGWNSKTASTQDMPVVDNKPPLNVSSPPRNTKSSHQSSSSSASHKNLPPVMIPVVDSLSATKSENLHLNSATITQLKDAEEDEWGEMVASPIVSAAPILPMSPKNLYKSSTSFGNDLPSTTDVRQSPVSQIQGIAQPQVLSAAATYGISAFEVPPPISSQLPKIEPLQSMNDNIAPRTTPSVSLSTSASFSDKSGESADPWASADFSFFEASPLPAASAQKVVPKINASRSIVPKTVKFSEPIPSSASTGRWKSKEETEQDAIVQNAVRGLPDLSYMLRR